MKMVFNVASTSATAGTELTMVGSLRVGSFSVLSDPVKGRIGNVFTFDERFRFYIHDLHSGVMHIEVFEQTDNLLEKVRATYEEVSCRTLAALFNGGASLTCCPVPNG